MNNLDAWGLDQSTAQQQQQQQQQRVHIGVCRIRISLLMTKIFIVARLSESCVCSYCYQNKSEFSAIRYISCSFRMDAVHWHDSESRATIDEYKPQGASQQQQEAERTIDSSTHKKRLEWTCIADYSRASQRIWTMAEVLFGKGTQAANSWTHRIKMSLKNPPYRTVLLTYAF